MNLKELADLIAEHTWYCQKQYQPGSDGLKHLSLDKALKFQDRMCQSLTHFGIWIDTVKSRETTDGNASKL